MMKCILGKKVHPWTERSLLSRAYQGVASHGWQAKLAPLLDLPVIDKDELLERLFETRGVGDSAWRRALSRESDLLFRTATENCNGALLVSFWRLPGMPSDSGTPTDWLLTLSRRIVNLQCECPPEVAAARYCQRQRHHGHLDQCKSPAQILASIQALAELKPLEIGRQLQCDTTSDVDLSRLVERISEALELAAKRSTA